MCYYTPLKGSGGKCRVCLVKVTQGSAKDTRPMPKLVASCITQVQDGEAVDMRVWRLKDDRSEFDAGELVVS